MPRALIAVVAVLLAGCSGSDARLVVPASPVDEAPVVRVEGLDAGEDVELRAAWRSDDGALWTSTQEVRADGDGTAKAGPEILTGRRPPETLEDPYFLPVLGPNRVELSVHSNGDTLARRWSCSAAPRAGTTG